MSDDHRDKLLEAAILARLPPEDHERLFEFHYERGHAIYTLTTDKAAVDAAMKARREGTAEDPEVSLIVQNNTVSYYVDNDDPWDPEAQRPCAYCGAQWKHGTPDPCLGMLPGVDNACCGHGVEEGYISFTSGTVVRGWFSKIDKGEPSTVDEDDEDAASILLYGRSIEEVRRELDRDGEGEP